MLEGRMCRRKADCAGMFSAQRQHFTWHRARTGVAFMIITDDPAVYLERAEMHAKLAAETADLPARTMHLAMAAEYRRKAAEISAVSITRPPTDPVVKVRPGGGWRSVDYLNSV